MPIRWKWLKINAERYEVLPYKPSVLDTPPALIVRTLVSYYNQHKAYFTNVKPSKNLYIIERHKQYQKTNLTN